MDRPKTQAKHPLRDTRSSAMIDREQLQDMSIDELWELHQDVDSVLGGMIAAKKQLLESRLEQLRDHGQQPGKRSRDSSET